ncbi:MAG TPA: endo alpha-1,4 polygalactosaminidase [Polyangia bacterium]|nr:endo alpha-1,4 polygalactosaminidase [Polyangia bacterium]
MQRRSVGFGLGLFSAALVAQAAEPVAGWKPAPGLSWQWQLSGTIDLTVDAVMFDVDLFDVPATTVAALHQRGRIAVCYVNAGSFENWRPDAPRFPAALKGKPLVGWPGESWLDIRQMEQLASIMDARMDLCRAKGFDGIELDNVDGYSNDTGFPLTAADQLRYNLLLANHAHARGLSVGLKNDLDQIPSLVGVFDWALNEECFAENECDRLLPFIAAGKAVFNVEYVLPAAAVICPRAKRLRFSTLIKDRNLGAKRQACP